MFYNLPQNGRYKLEKLAQACISHLINDLSNEYLWTVWVQTYGRFNHSYISIFYKPIMPMFRLIAETTLNIPALFIVYV